MQQSCKPRVVLLDFDGTVVDTMNYYARLAAEIIGREAGLPPEVVRERYMSTAGMAFRDQLRAMGLEGPEAERIARLFEEAKKPILESLKPHPRVAWFVREARGRGLLVYLSTNNECRVVESNRALLELFDGVLCHDPERGIRKGEAHVSLLESELGVRRCEIVFIGDSDYDVRLHEPLGVSIIRTRGLWADADRVLAELEELLRDP